VKKSAINMESAMLRLAKGFPGKHRRRVQKEWLAAAAIMLATLALFAISLLGSLDPDLGTVVLSIGLLLLVYLLPLTILLAWKSTFTARIGVSFERPPGGEKAELPPLYVRDRVQERFGRALARSWEELSAFARRAGIPGLDEFGVGNVRDLSPSYYDVARGLEVIEGLVRALRTSTSGLASDDRIIADLVHLKDQLERRPEGVQRFSLVMLSR